MADSSTQTAPQSPATTAVPAPGIRYPHITIEYCTQCKWMLRAAYFAQELLSTFSSTPIPSDPTSSTSTPAKAQFTVPTVSLVPSTGGVFTVTVYTLAEQTGTSAAVESKVLWDRKAEGGFPEVKVLKRRVRDVVDPGKGLGHVDQEYGKKKEEQGGKQVEVKEEVESLVKDEMCVDCL